MIILNLKNIFYDLRLSNGKVFFVSIQFYEKIIGKNIDEKNDSAICLASNNLVWSVCERKQERKEKMT